MSKPSKYEKSLEAIVFAASRHAKKPPSAVLNSSQLGDLLPELKQRDDFRLEVHKELIKSYDIQVDLKKIPIEPHLTLKDLALTISVLGGDPTVDDELTGNTTTDDD